MARHGRFFVSMSDAWAKNERMIQRLDQKEDHYPGGMDKPTKRIGLKGGKQMEVHEDAALGLDGSEFHMGGMKVTNYKEEPTKNGDFNVYWLGEDGHVYKHRWEKVGEGRHTPTDRPRRTTSF